jgi:SRSO17 transposase
MILPIYRIPEKVSGLLQDLEMFFTMPQWNHVQTLLLSLLSTPFKPTIVGQSRVIAGGVHRTKRNEFCQNHDEILVKALRFYAVKLISLLYRKGAPLYVVLDDSKAKKRGKHVQAAAKMFDHVSKGFLWGHQFVCITLSYRGMTIPYAIVLYRPKEDCKKRKLPFQKLTSIAEDLIRDMPDFGVSKVYVLADTYYASKRIIRCVRSKGYHFVTVLKSNRRILVNGRSTTIRRFIARHFTRDRKRSVHVGKRRYRTISQQVYLPGVGEGKLVISQVKGCKTALALFSTEVTADAASIVTSYRVRWSIEIFFKLSKQYLGLTAYHHRDERAVRSHLQLVLLAYCLLTHLFVDEQRAKDKSISQQLLRKFSLRQSQSHVRALVTIDALDFLKEHAPRSKGDAFDLIKSHLLAA